MESFMSLSSYIRISFIIKIALEIAPLVFIYLIFRHIISFHTIQSIRLNYEFKKAYWFCQEWLMRLQPPVISTIAGRNVWLSLELCAPPTAYEDLVCKGVLILEPMTHLYKRTRHLIQISSGYSVLTIIIVI